MTKPRPIAKQQLGVARYYTKRCGRPANTASVHALARSVPTGFTGTRPQDRAWKIEVFKGRTPTPKAVRNRLFFMEGHRRREQAHAKAAHLAAHLDYDRLGPQITEWIGHYLDDHGTGPHWSEVGKQWGWDRVHTHAILRAMHRAGWVTSTEQPRSLRPSHPNTVQTPPSGGNRDAGRRPQGRRGSSDDLQAKRTGDS